MKRAAVLALALAACDATEAVPADEVVVDLVLPDSLVADGTATARLELVTPDESRVGLTGRLTIVGASWAEVTTPSLDVTIGSDGRAIAVVQASRLPGTALIRAQVEGFERTFELPLTAAAVPEVAHVTSGRITPGTAAMVQVTATPIVDDGGLASVGTRVDFAIAAAPAGSAYLTTPFAVLDAAATGAATTVVTGASTQSVVVTIGVTPPGAAAPTATATVPIAAVP